jgi:hypothetical protein
MTLKGGAAWSLGASMKTISMMATASAIAFFANSFAAASEAARLDPSHPGRITARHMMKAERIASSQATHSARRRLRGIGYSNSFRDDEGFEIRITRALPTDIRAKGEP